MKPQHIGQALRFIRQAQGMGQGEVAAKAGIVDNYVSLIETGQREPSFTVVCKMCRALGVSLALLAIVHEADHPFVRPLLPLAYMEISRLSKEKENAVVT